MYSLKRTLTCVAVLLILILLSGCDGSTGFIDGPIRSTPRQFGSLEFVLSAPKSRFARGEDVPLTLTVRNITAQTVITDAANPVPYVFQVRQNAQTIWQSSQAGGGVVTRFTFAPNETKTFTQSWNQRSIPTNIVVPIGSYQVRAWYDVRNIDGVPFTADESASQLNANPIDITLRL